MAKKTVDNVIEYDRLYPAGNVVLPEWTPEDGLCEGHYAARPPGSRWIATTGYETSRGRITPDELIPVEKMTRQQIRLELLDHVWRGELDSGGDAARKLLELDDAPGDRVPAAVRSWLIARRGSCVYPIASWDPPKKIWRPVYRKGWAPQHVRFPVTA